MYRRRVCCRQPEKDQKEDKTFEEEKSRKVKTESWVNDEGKELQAKRKYKVENDMIRFQREAN